MKAAIVEDEAVFADRLRQRVDELFRSKGRQAEISCFPDGGAFLSALQKGEHFGLVFFDIQLGSDDGMDLAARLRKYDKNAAVIFVTGLSDRAAEGYEVEAFDYIVKSHLDERLENVLDRFFGRLEKSSLSVSLADGGRALIPFYELYAAVSEGRGTALYTVQGQLYTGTAVGKISPELPARDYFEIHKGVYVRIERIRSIGSDTLKMSDGRIFPVSRRRRKPLLTAVMERARGEWE